MKQSRNAGVCVRGAVRTILRGLSLPRPDPNVRHYCTPVAIGFPKKLNQAVYRATLQPSFKEWDTELNRLQVMQIYMDDCREDRG